MAKVVKAKELDAEEWRPVPSFPGYSASSFGRVRGPTGRVLRFAIGRGGYLQFSAYRDGKARCGRVNRFICEAFYGPSPTPEHEAAHWNGDRTNNIPDNLRWATTKDNHNDKRRHGTHREAANHPRAQLSEAEVRAIKRTYSRLRTGKYVKRGTIQQLAIRFGVNVWVVKDIVQGRSWKTIA